MSVGTTQGQIGESSLGGALDALWAKFLPDILDRVAILDSASQAATAGRLSDEERHAAHSAAHKLAGVLGTFGLTQGTGLARELETAYASQAGAPSGERLAAIASELRSIIADRK